MALCAPLVACGAACSSSEHVWVPSGAAGASSDAGGDVLAHADAARLVLGFLALGLAIVLVPWLIKGRAPA